MVCYDATGMVFAFIFAAALVACMGCSCAKVCDSRQRPGRRLAPPPRDDARFPYFMSTTTGLWLFRRLWKPAEGTPVKAVVVFLHGYGEYIDRYDAAASVFARSGIVFWGFDFEGHGRSDGERGFVTEAGFDAFTDDAEQALRLAARQFPGLPIFVLGHSLGGLVAVRLGARLAKAAEAVDAEAGAPLFGRIKGFLLSAPAIEVDPAVAQPHLVFIARVLGSCMPRIRLGGIPAGDLSNNATVNDHYSRDSMNNTRPFAARFASGVLAATEAVPGIAADFTWPLLGMQDEGDKTTVPGACERFVHTCGSPDAAFKLLRGRKHELFMADGYEDLITGTIMPWIEERCETAEPEAGGAAAAEAGLARDGMSGDRDDEAEPTDVDAVKTTTSEEPVLGAAV